LARSHGSSEALHAASIYVDVELGNADIEHPVLIDLDADEITTLEWDASSTGRLRHIPVRDSVLAIADRSYFDWQILPEVPSRLIATARSHSVCLHWAGGDDNPGAVLIESRRGDSRRWNTL
jgi:hypothetical protein